MAWLWIVLVFIFLAGAFSEVYSKKENKKLRNIISYIKDKFHRGYDIFWSLCERNVKVTVSLVIAVIVIAIFSAWYFAPKKYSETFDGVYYQLSSEGTIEHIKVHLDGKLENHLNGKRTFKGFIDIIGNKVPHISEDRTRLELAYNGHHFATIFSSFRKLGGALEGRTDLDMYIYGNVYINDTFTKFTIKLIMGGSLSEKDGYMITFPAKNREGAMKTYQKLIKEFEEEW